MATTVTQAFAQFKANLEITGLQSTTVSTRQQNVRSNVAASLTVLDSFLTGSYMRSTMIAPLEYADIDIFIVLDSSHFDGTANGPANVLARLKRVIDNAYSTTTQASRNGQAVSIRFSDFVVDVVPAFNRQGGGYLIPDPGNRSWISTNPKTHVELWSKMNAQQDGMFVPFIKMIKAWNRAHSEVFRSFHLEAIIRDVFLYQRISSFSQATLYLFENAYNHVYVSDPSGYGGSLASYLSNDTTRFMDIYTKFSTNKDRASEAINLEGSYRIDQAIAKWRMIFGDYFPAYG